MSQGITFVHFLTSFLPWSPIVPYFIVYFLGFIVEILQTENRFFLFYLGQRQLLSHERLDIYCFRFPRVVRFVKFLNELIFILLMLSLALLLIGLAPFGKCSNSSNSRFRLRVLLYYVYVIFIYLIMFGQRRNLLLDFLG